MKLEVKSIEAQISCFKEGKMWQKGNQNALTLPKIHHISTTVQQCGDAVHEMLRSHKEHMKTFNRVESDFLEGSLVDIIDSVVHLADACSISS